MKKKNSGKCRVEPAIECVSGSQFTVLGDNFYKKTRK